ncbi:Uncharacterized protein KF715C_ch16260 [Pseudomonas putida]|uniref:Uncharacterized protein n=1 Tax=Pseudomonas putida TaxID=303 RepID=A0A1L7N9Q6_PSEPU|nr:Uncharacterized protein KF715C_ch16260 [Pseudomonas putida]GLO21652.1 hypothetical protein PPUJ20188_50490 [Pseudomonas putida]
MGVGQFAQQPFQRRGFTRRQVKRVHAHRAIDIGVLLAQRLHGTGVFGTDANTQKMTDPTLTRCLQSGIEGALVGAQVKTVEVAMGIYEHRMTTHMKK